MTTVILACEALRPEIQILTDEMPSPPVIRYLEMGLHTYPDILRGAFQEAVDTFEKEIDGPLTILCGYGLCGRALCGVRASRATLVFPKTHDCTPLILGVEQKKVRSSTPTGAIYWLFPGMFTCATVFTRHLDEEARFAEYEKKYGPVRAARLLKLENDYMKDYSQACHIRWAEMGDKYVSEAKRVAQCVYLPYAEVEGSSGYMAELLQGGRDPEKFLRLAPGESIDMDVEGAVCSVCGNA